MNDARPTAILSLMRGRPPNEPVEKFPNRLREWRERRGISQKELAARIKVQGMTVSRHERGEAQIHLRHMRLYAEALTIRPEDLMLAEDRTGDRIEEIARFAARLPPDKQEKFLAMGRVAFHEDAAPFVTEPADHKLKRRRGPKVKS